MSDSEQTKDRESTLAEFGRKMEEYAHTYDSVPDDALTYVPEGEDYTLGGLAVHVTDVLLHYGNVLDVMKGAGGQQVRAVDPEDEAKRQRDELIHNGFGGGDKQRVFREMRAAHQDVEQRVRTLPVAEYGQKVGVLYGADAQDPYPTDAGDVLGWLIDHYQEHIDQVAELMGKWRAAR
jgi:DinB superfamily